MRAPVRTGKAVTVFTEFDYKGHARIASAHSVNGPLSS